MVFLTASVVSMAGGRLEGMWVVAVWLGKCGWSVCVCCLWVEVGESFYFFFVPIVHVGCFRGL